MTTVRTITVDYLARVEGEGSLELEIHGDEVRSARFKIFEPPRFFEAFLRGRDFREVPDITARICGICPVAYQMSSVHAIERACGIQVEDQLRELRRLLYCGEWIESHVLHVCMLHVPDFLGFDDVIQMASVHPDLVKKGLELKKTGNDIVALLGGREIHPINVRVGGFYRVPSREELETLRPKLEKALGLAAELLEFVSGLEYPDLERNYDFVALRHPAEYPLNEGRLVSTSGLDIDAEEYESHFEEEHVAHSNALRSVLHGNRSYLVGPMARYNLNFDRLSPESQRAALRSGLQEHCRNQFQSVIVRCVETFFACEEALRIIDQYVQPRTPALAVEPLGAVGQACTEAPRGILYHRYRLDHLGHIQDAKIVPPTSQNQRVIEDDLWEFAAANLRLDDPTLTWKCEQLIRNYDPCISCATHFLKLKVNRV